SVAACAWRAPTHPGCCAVRTARPRRAIVLSTHLAREGRMTVTIGRRELLAALGGAAAAWPLAARAQQSGKMPRVGVLVSLSAPHPFTEALRSGMHDLGYVEGRNIAIEWRYADAQFSRAAELAAELVRLQVDVIAAYHTPAVRAAINATRTIPIVMAPAGAPL